jgi:hypothetical protein
MKKLILLSLLFRVITLCAQDNRAWPVQLQKDYSKSYPVSAENIVLLNRFGKMKVETWDKPEVSVAAHISVSAQSNEYAAKLVERITIKDEKENGSIIYKTNLGDNDGNWSEDNKGGHEMHIDWIVYVPANAKLHAENHFGPLTIGDYKGESELICKYGTLTAGKISNCKELRVDFGKATISELSDSKLSFRYSRIDIGKLAGKIEGEMQFCSSIDLPVDNDLKQLTLKNNYTSLYLMVPKDMSADYDITTNNARLTAKNGMTIKEEEPAEKEQPRNGIIRPVLFTPNHHYTGSLGKGGTTRIEIRSSFGNIRIL